MIIPNTSHMHLGTSKRQNDLRIEIFTSINEWIPSQVALKSAEGRPILPLKKLWCHKSMKLTLKTSQLNANLSSCWHSFKAEHFHASHLLPARFRHPAWHVLRPFVQSLWQWFQVSIRGRWSQREDQWCPPLGYLRITMPKVRDASKCKLEKQIEM